jgi:glycosyltransferase involved in cell wall biosynthesis
MKTSIAMTTYNGEQFILEQLNSFLEQSCLPDELIICDDCSTDNTISIIEKFCLSSPFRVKLVKNKINLGYVKNFEKALSLCSGELIFLSDQDDVWFPEKIQAIKIYFKQSNAALLAIHDARIVDDRLNWMGVTSLGQIQSGFGSDEHLITGALSVIHKDLLQFILPFPNRLSELTNIGHDGWVHLLAKFMGTRHVIECSLQLIRRHSLNTSAWIASSTKKINKFKVFLAHFKTTPALSYKDRLYLNEVLHSRLIYAKSNQLSDEKFCAIATSLCYLISERRAILLRSKLLTSGFLMKRWTSLQMLFCGDYKYFNGLNSFFRDFVR